MSAMQALERLNAARAKSGSSDADRANYAALLVKMRDEGWTAQDVADYSAGVRALMAPDDAAALALFPAGTYATADQARQGARDFWRGAAC